MITILSQENRMAVLPDGRSCHIIWAKKIFDNIYKFSLKVLNTDGYTMWYAQINEDGVKWISCALYESIETLVIRMKEMELNGETE